MRIRAAGQLRAMLPNAIILMRPSDVDPSEQFAVSMLYRTPGELLKVKTIVRRI